MATLIWLVNVWEPDLLSINLVPHMINFCILHFKIKFSLSVLIRAFAIEIAFVFVT